LLLAKNWPHSNGVLPSTFRSANSLKLGLLLLSFLSPLLSFPMVLHFIVLLPFGRLSLGSLFEGPFSRLRFCEPWRTLHNHGSFSPSSHEIISHFLPLSPPSADPPGVFFP